MKNINARFDGNEIIFLVKICQVLTSIKDQNKFAFNLFTLCQKILFSYFLLFFG